MKRKVETIYPDGAPDSGMIAALERAWKKGAADYNDLVIYAGKKDAVEAAMIRPRDDVEIIYLGVVSRGAPAVLWRSAGRFTYKQIGVQPTVEIRALRTDLGARELAALECAQGRDGLAEYLVDECPKAEPLKIEAVCMVRLPSGSKTIQVKVNGHWLGAGRFTKLEYPQPGPSRAERGINYPETQIV